jgi:hypothetical protein
MSLSVAVAVRNALLNGSASYASHFNSGSMVLYAGTPPANADTALGGGNTVIATLPFSPTAFGAASGGSMTANAITPENAVASLDATFFRCLDSTSGVIEQGTVTATGMGGDATFDSVSFVSGGRVEISSFVRTL